MNVLAADLLNIVNGRVNQLNREKLEVELKMSVIITDKVLWANLCHEAESVARELKKATEEQKILARVMALRD